MKNLFVLTLLGITLIAIAMAACQSFQTIANYNAQADAANLRFYNDLRLAIQPAATGAPFVSSRYNLVDNDAAFCATIYGAIAKEGASSSQLTRLTSALNKYRAHDSLGASITYFQLTEPVIDSAALRYVRTEETKVGSPYDSTANSLN